MTIHILSSWCARCDFFTVSRLQLFACCFPLQVATLSMRAAGVEPAALHCVQCRHALITPANSFRIMRTFLNSFALSCATLAYLRLLPRYIKSNIFICLLSQKSVSSMLCILVLFLLFHTSPIISGSFSNLKSSAHNSGWLFRKCLNSPIPQFGQNQQPPPSAILVLRAYQVVFLCFLHCHFLCVSVFCKQ